MQQSGPSAFYMVVCWHKWGEAKSEWTSHNFIVLAICVPIWWRFDEVLTKTSWVVFSAYAVYTR